MLVFVCRGKYRNEAGIRSDYEWSYVFGLAVQAETGGGYMPVLPNRKITIMGYADMYELHAAYKLTPVEPRQWPQEPSGA